MGYIERRQDSEVDVREVPGGEGFQIVGLVILMAANSLVWLAIGFVAGRLL